MLILNILSVLVFRDNFQQSGAIVEESLDLIDFIVILHHELLVEL